MSLLRSFFETDRKAIFVSIFASTVSGACTALLIAFIGKQFGSTENFDAASVLWFFALLATAQMTSLYASRTLIKVSSQYSCSIRLKFCRRILNTEFATLEEVGGHRLTAALSEDMTNIASAFVRLPDLIIDSTRLLFCFGYLLWLAPGVVSALLIMYIPVAYVQILLLEKSRHEMRQILPIRDRRYELYQLMIVGLKEMLVNRFWQHGFYWTHLMSNAEEYKQSQIRMLMATQYALQWAQSTYFIVIFGLLVVSSYGYVGAGVVASFALVGLFIRSSINNLINGIPVLFRAKTASEKITSLFLSENSAAPPSERRVTVGSQWNHPNELILSELRFSYPNDISRGKTTLGPVDLNLQMGEIVFITGGNGSGKTTLVKLLTSLYQPTSGEIYLDGQIVSPVNREWYQEHFYCLFSDFNLSREYLNSICSLENHPESKALKMLMQHNAAIADPIDTKSTDRYSSGERARLALYPMLALDRPIVIFDEWAAHQAPTYKRLFYHELLPELKSKGKLVIVVTHDDRHFGVADRLFKLDDGVITEQ